MFCSTRANDIALTWGTPIRNELVSQSIWSATKNPLPFGMGSVNGKGQLYIAKKVRDYLKK